MSNFEIGCDIVLALCAVVLLLNWLGLLSAVRSRQTYSFAPPLVGGVLAAATLLVHPHSGAWLFFPVPLILDPSIILPLIMLRRAPPS